MNKAGSSVIVFFGRKLTLGSHLKLSFNQVLSWWEVLILSLSHRVEGLSQ